MKKVLLTAILACGVAMAGEANATAAKADANATAAKAETNATAAAPAAGAVDGKAKFAKEALKGYKAGTRNVHGMGGVMKGQVASYSDADIKAVATYISSLK